MIPDAMGVMFAPTQETLCRLLRQVREEAGKRQYDVAVALGKPQSFVSKYESGQRRLDILELLAVCQAVGIAPTVFLRRLTEEAP
jgi:transcriptional regulator with XRE-family HTH domain